MKTKIIALSFILLCNLAFSQKVSKIDTLIVVGITKDLNKYKTKVEVKNLILPDNSVISKGSDLIVGTPSNLVNINNNVYNGVKLLNTTIDFTYVFADRFSILGAVLAEAAFTQEQKGMEIVVEDITMYKSGKKYDFVVNFTKKDGSSVATGKFGHINSLIDALNNGEIINPNRAMTREEAIRKLKESKDLLDLEMISQEEYEKIKKELSPIIKGN